MSGIYTKPYGNASINDNTSSINTVYSSSKTEALLDEKVDKIDGIENNFLSIGLNGEIKDSGKKSNDFSNSGHTHSATSMQIDTTNFGGLLDNTITDVQKLADFLDDNIDENGGHNIQDEGVSLTKRDNLNFKGAGVTITDNSITNSTDVNIDLELTPLPEYTISNEIIDRNIDLNNMSLNEVGNTLGTLIEDIKGGLIGPQGVQGIQGEQGIPGINGLDGLDGIDGQGVPTGGTTGQILAKIDGTDYNTEWIEPETGIEWNTNITGTSGTGLTTTIGNSASSGTTGKKVSIGTTQINIVKAVDVDFGSNADNVGHIGYNINYPAGGGKAININSVAPYNNRGTSYGIYMGTVSQNAQEGVGMYMGDLGANQYGKGTGIVIGNRSSNTSKFIDFNSSSSLSGGYRISNLRDIKSELIYTAPFSSLISDFDVLNITRKSEINDIQSLGTYNTKGSVLSLNNNVIQTSGTSNDNTSVLELNQSNMSNGGHIKFNSNTPLNTTNIEDGVLWFDGTNFKAKVGGVVKTFTLT